MDASPSRRLTSSVVARSLIPLAVLATAFALLPLGASAAPASFQLVFDGHHVAAQCPPACNAEGLVHVGTFTTNDARCLSGHGEDVAQSYEGREVVATRLFACDGSSATFTATVYPFIAEHGIGTGEWQIVSGTGPLADLRGKGSFSSVITSGDLDNSATMTFRSTWTGVVDLDRDASDAHPHQAHRCEAQAARRDVQGRSSPRPRRRRRRPRLLLAHPHRSGHADGPRSQER